MSINFLEMAKKYNVKNFKSDFIASLSVSAVSIPQNMAYAMIAGLNPVYGIYTHIVATIVSFFTGVSSYMVIGPTNIIAVTIASTLNNMEVVNSSNYLQIVLMLTLLVGIIQVILGSLQLGNFINYISQSVISGLTMGVAVIIGASQLNKLLGLAVDSGTNVVITIYKVMTNIQGFNNYALLLALVSMFVIIVVKKYIPGVPPYLMAVIISIIIVYFFNLDQKLALVGTINSSVPTFKPVEFDVSIYKRLASSALSIAIIGFIQVLSIVKAIEQKTGEEAQINREFVGLGLSNIACAFFKSFSVTGSFTASFTNYETGAKTRVSELFTGLVVLVLIVLFAPVVKYIPISTLATIVIFVAYSIFDLEEIKQHFKTTNFDAVVFTVTFMTTILTPRLDYAIFLGVFISFILVLRNTSDINYTHISYEKEREKEKFTHQNIDEVREDDYIVINLSGTLHFNTADNLKKKLNDSFLKNKVFVIRMRDVDDIDITAIRELEKFIDRVEENGGEVILCGLIQKVYKTLANYGIIDKIDSENAFCSNDHIFASTKDAIEKADKKAEKNVN